MEQLEETGVIEVLCMNVDLRVQLGIMGSSCLLSPIYLDSVSVGADSSWAGSYHILSMGQHYDDYVVTDSIINFPPIAGFPAAHPYVRLTSKIRAAGVTGNIGEVIAAKFARRYLMAEIGDIAHIQPIHRRKAPDYLMRLGGLMPGPFRDVLPDGISFSWPGWWPVESKARRTTNGSITGRHDALRQLVSYWTILANSQPSAVGYGLIVVFTYQRQQEVTASLILPINQSGLVKELQRNHEGIDEGTMRSFLHGC